MSDSPGDGNDHNRRPSWYPSPDSERDGIEWEAHTHEDNPHVYHTTKRWMALRWQRQGLDVQPPISDPNNDMDNPQEGDHAE
jgi:hypothetical protein